jgi:hypothetical protein
MVGLSRSIAGIAPCRRLVKNDAPAAVERP